MTKTTTPTDTSPPTTMRIYRIDCEGYAGLPEPTKTVEAAYFQHDEEFTVFKDANGKAVLAIKSKIVRMIERAEPARADGSEEV